jgi:hypothetical protein
MKVLIDECLPRALKRLFTGISRILPAAELPSSF